MSAVLVRPLFDLDPTDLPSNMQLSGIEDHSIEVTTAFNRARAIFQKLCPDEDFLVAEPPPQAQTPAAASGGVEPEEEEVAYMRRALDDATTAEGDSSGQDENNL